MDIGGRNALPPPPSPPLSFFFFLSSPKENHVSLHVYIALVHRRFLHIPYTLTFSSFFHMQLNTL